MFQCFAMTDCGLKTQENDWIDCDDTDTIQCLVDEDYGCCDCGTTEGLEFVEVLKDSVWLQCSDCAHESFCESRDCARSDNYREE